MNENILNPEVQKFISEHLNDDLSKLIFKGSPFDSITVQELAEQIVSKKKSEHKLPTWFTTENIYYPNKINIEQTSSEITAKYKSDLISGTSFIDITGGFGIDDYYFAKKFSSGVHCELNSELSAIAQHNFEQLGVSNVEFIKGNGVEYILKNDTLYDWIYSDPSRRNESKGKVFLLADCLPDIPSNLDELFHKTDHILLKLSPVLDITSALNELKYTKEIHIVGVNNEVKELLFILQKGFIGNPAVKTVNISKKKTEYFDFNYREESPVSYSNPKTYLYEPNTAILKSGGFSQVSTQLGVDKLHQHSHLYTSSQLIEFPGRSFKIEAVLPYDKKKLKQLIPSKKANITVRNFPETVQQIRKKTGFKDGGEYYLFFTTSEAEKKIVILCEKP